MVDIKEESVVLPSLLDKTNVPDLSVVQAVDESLLQDEIMEDLAYSDSDAASAILTDDEFKDAMDHLPDISDESTANGKLIFYHSKSFT